MFSTVHQTDIYADGIARETMHFIAGLLGDQQVYYTTLFYFTYDTYMSYVTISIIILRREINGRVKLLPPAIAVQYPRFSFCQLIVP